MKVFYRYYEIEWILVQGEESGLTEDLPLSKYLSLVSNAICIGFKIC